MDFLKPLYVQVLVGVILGVLLGYYFPEVGIHLKWIADIFIRLIKMLIGPIVFLTLVSGIAAIHDTRKIGKLAGGALLFFFVLTTAALLVGLLACDYVQPGAGLYIDPNTLDAEEAKVYMAGVHPVTHFSDLLLNSIPKTFVSAFVDGEMLQVLFVSLLFALGLICMGDKATGVVKGMHLVVKVFFQMMHLVMYLAPLATCAAMAFSVGKFGITPLFHLFGLLACYYVTSILFVVIALGSVMRWYCDMHIWQVLKYLRKELLIVWGTSSSETVLPNVMEKLERLGCEKSIVGLVLPLGYSFNLAGTAMYLTMAAMFIAQATQTEMTFWQQLSLLGVMIISSKGAAGVSGSGFIVLASSLAAIGHIPPAGIVLVLGIDKFLNEGRTIINLVGNAIATILIAKWQDAFDVVKAHEALKEDSDGPRYQVDSLTP